MSASVSGVLVSDDAVAALRNARMDGKEVQMRTAAPHGAECPNCGGLGVIVFGLRPPRPGAEERANWPWDARLESTEVLRFACPMCAADRPTRLDMLWRQAGISESERRWRLDYYSGMEGKQIAVQACAALLEQSPRPAGWLTLYGPYGVGKTGMLKTLTASLCAAGVHACYTRANDILIELRGSFRDRSEFSEAELLTRWGHYQFLAVDEIDRTGDTAWAKSALFTLLDHRYSRRDQVATAMGTNLMPTDLPGDLGYLASRMLDGERVPIGGDVLRGR